jgi:hypothetical protein
VFGPDRTAVEVEKGEEEVKKVEKEITAQAVPRYVCA